MIAAVHSFQSASYPAAWVCLLLPLGGAVLITLLGTGISRRTAGWISTLSCGGAFAAAVVAFAQMLSRSILPRLSQ